MASKFTVTLDTRRDIPGLTPLTLHDHIEALLRELGADRNKVDLEVKGAS